MTSTTKKTKPRTSRAGSIFDNTAPIVSPSAQQAGDPAPAPTPAPGQTAPPADTTQPGGQPDTALSGEVVHTRRHTGGAAPAVPDLDALPLPYVSDAEGELTPEEEADRIACETVIDGLNPYFVATGQALQVLRDGNLYRKTHPNNWDGYVFERFGFRRQHAHRLIEGWQLSKALLQRWAYVNAAHSTALQPIAKRHGNHAAITVFGVLDASGKKVTATLVERAVKALPTMETFDPDLVATHLRTWLNDETAGERRDPDVHSTRVSVVPNFESTVSQTVTSFKRKLNPAMLPPEQARMTAIELRHLADEYERAAAEHATEHAAGDTPTAEPGTGP
ncbi:MAG: hypothetical protein J2P26_05410 [Nocardiopsaceae bacterium]|nr:hypothetical protein [Nocardiopsaceae bacterium]